MYVNSCFFVLHQEVKCYNENMSKGKRDSEAVNRARGAFLGLAIGDALGHPFEFCFQSELIRERMNEVRHLPKERRNAASKIIEPKGNWTDDTSMALCLADSLIEKNGYDSYDIMDKYYKWLFEGYRTYFPIGFGVGSQTRDAINDYLEEKTVKKNTPKTESIGNGCIMRLAPIVIVNIDNSIEEILRAARLSARETHNSLGAMAIAELMAATLYLLLKGGEKENLLEESKKLVRNEESIRFLESVKSSHDSINDSKGDTLRDLGGYALDCYNIAMWGLMNFDSFRYGMLGVIGLGGDTDTNAAVYGQLAGAYYDYNSIPDEWKEDIYLGDEITELSDKLVKIGKYSILRTRFEDDKDYCGTD